MSKLLGGNRHAPHEGSDIPVLPWICGDSVVYVHPTSESQLAAARHLDRIASMPPAAPAIARRLDRAASSDTALHEAVMAADQSWPSHYHVRVPDGLRR